MVNKINFHEEIRKNKNTTIVLVIFFMIFVSILGGFFGYMYGNPYFGFGTSTIIAVVYSLIVFSSGDSMILTMTGAKPVQKSEYPHLYHSVEGLAIAAGIPTPKAYVIQDTALNAFATGKDPEHSSIVVTSGLLAKLNRQELEGVIAHEMSHIKNYDIRVMMITTVLVGVTALISDFMLRSMFYSRGSRKSNSDNGSAQLIMLVVGVVLAILSPIIAQLMKLAISRKREYLADANGAKLTRYPEGLASALEKIRADPDPLVDHANNATAHLFISTPFRKKSFYSNLFATHPPIKDRIQKLRSM